MQIAALRLHLRAVPAALVVVAAAGSLLSRGVAPEVSAAADGARSSRFDAARAAIADVMKSGAPASITVAVAERGGIVWEEGFGWADRERGKRATPHTMYSLASISKPITATALMTLVERGRIDLDRPVEAYLGAARLAGLNGDAAAATVRRVLSHTAGLPLHYQFFYRGAGYPRPPMEETIARYAILVSPPGEVYHYSNLGYGLLDHAIATVSGRSYAAYLRAEVFEPLGMSRSSVDVADGLEAYAAQRYDSQRRPIPFYEFDHPGGSAVYASAHDLAKFGMFSLGRRLEGQRPILSRRTLDLMQRIATPGDPASGYGLGWRLDEERGYRRVGHTGGMPGVSTLLHLYPERDLVLVVLSNGGGVPVHRVAAEIAGAVLPRWPPPGRMGRRSAPASTRSRVPPRLRGVWSGTVRTYERTVPLRLIFGDDGSVEAELDDQPRTRLAGVTFGGGALTGRLAGRIPSADQSRHPHSILLHLRLRDGTLRGQATAQTIREPIYYALSSYVELRKAADGEP